MCLQGVYHRDIKPGNFLFSRKDHKGYLIDFNLARVSASAYVKGFHLGRIHQRPNFYSVIHLFLIICVINYRI